MNLDTIPVLGLLLAFLSGAANGLFTVPMKVIRTWKWENIWLVFIVVSCLVIPAVVVPTVVGNVGALLEASPRGAIGYALSFGCAFGFGAIMFGQSVDRLGVSLANSLMIGISAAMGSIVPLILQGAFRLESRLVVLMAGIATFLAGVWLCGVAGKLREEASGSALRKSGILIGYVFAIGSGFTSGIRNVGYALAQPIVETATQLGHPPFHGTSTIWMLILGAASLPNIGFCIYLMRRKHTGGLFARPGWRASASLSILMGVLWGGNVFLYAAATPLLGDIGPSIGWALSFSVALFMANLGGLLLGEWRDAPETAKKYMRAGIVTLLAATVICAASTTIGKQ